MWVVNDSTTDKVFKYTLSGTLVGSWTIGSANSKPTGITLDPASGDHMWIVDSGTDRVYQYDSAVGRTSGSQGPSTSFPLASGNTNPQGIADPPAPSSASVREALRSPAFQSHPFDVALAQGPETSAWHAHRPRLHMNSRVEPAVSPRSWITPTLALSELARHCASLLDSLGTTSDLEELTDGTDDAMEAWDAADFRLGAIAAPRGL